MCSGRPGALSNAMPMLFLGLWSVFFLKWRRLFVVGSEFSCGALRNRSFSARVT